jgi:hypothetical protein
MTWEWGEWDSGFWHHLQRRLQPLKKTTVRIPGPSSVAYRSISKTVAEMLRFPDSMGSLASRTTCAQSTAVLAAGLPDREVRGNDHMLLLALLLAAFEF